MLRFRIWWESVFQALAAGFRQGQDDYDRWTGR